MLLDKHTVLVELLAYHLIERNSIFARNPSYANEKSKTQEIHE
jgi:hypothetical protein